VPSPADRLADARTATQPDDEAAYQALTAELRRVRGKLAEAHADCARYVTERDEARRLPDQTTAALNVALHHASDNTSYSPTTDHYKRRAAELDGCRIALQEATEATTAAASVPSRRAQDEPPRLTSDQVGLRSVQAHVDQLQAERHHAQGYAEAVASFRDDARYLDWWTSSGVRPDGRLRHHLADYLEAVGPDGPDVTAPKLATGGIGTPVAHTPTSPTGDTTDATA
jgi:hypothetical protein